MAFGTHYFKQCSSGRTKVTLLRNVHTHTKQIKKVEGEIEDTHIYTYIQILRFFSVKVSGYKLSVLY